MSVVCKSSRDSERGHHVPPEGWPVEAVGDRADVSREVLDKHYNMADQAGKRERREQFLDRL